MTVRLINLLRAIRELSPFSNLAPDEELLLHDLVVRWHQNAEIIVSDVMQDGKHSSPTTAYRRLVALRDKGLIEMRVDDLDRRVRHVKPTDKAHEYMRVMSDKLDDLINQARSE